MSHENKIPQFDTDGREWCSACQEYLYKWNHIGDLHKLTQEHKEINELSERVKKLEINHISFDEQKELFNKVDDLEKCFISFKQDFESFINKDYKKPYKCPVCNGSGRYKLATALCESYIIYCRACNGKCILWG